MRKLLIYALDNLKEFKLILCKSEGTRFPTMIYKMVEIETKSTYNYLEVLKKLGRPPPYKDEHL